MSFENFENLCLKKFNSKGNSVIRGSKQPLRDGGDIIDDFGWGTREKRQICNGDFVKWKKERRLKVEEKFKMPWFEFVSIVKYGDRDWEKCCKGFCGSLLIDLLTQSDFREVIAKYICTKMMDLKWYGYEPFKTDIHKYDWNVFAISDQLEELFRLEPGVFRGEVAFPDSYDFSNVSHMILEQILSSDIPYIEKQIKSRFGLSEIKVIVNTSSITFLY